MMFSVKLTVRLGREPEPAAAHIEDHTGYLADPAEPVGFNREAVPEQ